MLRHRSWDQKAREIGCFSQNLGPALVEMGARLGLAAAEVTSGRCVVLITYCSTMWPIETRLLGWKSFPVWKSWGSPELLQHDKTKFVDKEKHKHGTFPKPFP